MRTASLACLTLGLVACSDTSKIPTSKPLRPGAPATVVAAPPTVQVVAAAPSGLDWASTRAMLTERRGAQLARLQDYAAAGRFPVNRVRRGQLNVFVDERTGALCAVANLMSLSGEPQLVARTAMNDNFVRLADVHDGPLHEWILASGLTQEEIAAIQEPYYYQGDDGGTDVPVEPQADVTPSAVAPVAIQPSPAVREKRRLQRHFRDLGERLRADSARSLDLATARLLARSAAI